MCALKAERSHIDAVLCQPRQPPTLPRIKYDMYVHKTGITDANGDGEEGPIAADASRPGGSRSCVTALHNATPADTPRLTGRGGVPAYPLSPVNARSRNSRSYM